MDRLKAQRDAKKADESDEPADGLVTGRLGGGAQVMPRSTRNFSTKLGVLTALP